VGRFGLQRTGGNNPQVRAQGERLHEPEGLSQPALERRAIREEPNQVQDAGQGGTSLSGHQAHFRFYQDALPGFGEERHSALRYLMPWPISIWCAGAWWVSHRDRCVRSVVQRPQNCICGAEEQCDNPLWGTTPNTEAKSNGYSISIVD